ncbi:MAG: hypothetical protein JW866_07180 [Ignavibacteriales bacterium]|nr:hypothetical protein [Ignavibacteriales bacterium]
MDKLKVKLRNKNLFIYLIYIGIIILVISTSCAQEKMNINMSRFYQNLPEGFREQNNTIIDSLIDNDNGYMYLLSTNEFGECHYSLKVFKNEKNKIIFVITYDYPLRECTYYSWLFLEYNDGDLNDAFKKVFPNYYEYPDSVLYQMGRAYPLLSAKLFYDDKETLQLLKDYINYYAADKSVPYDYIFSLSRFEKSIDVTLSICDTEFEENISTKEKFDKLKSEAKTITFNWNNKKEVFNLE